MSDYFPKGLPSDHGFKTLGWGCLNWATKHLVNGDGDEDEKRGKPWVFTKDQARFILWFYAVDDIGRFVFRRAYRERAKGVGKTPMAAAIACIELLGPVKFVGWDKNGNAIGKRNANALVQIAAVSEDQAEQTMKLVRAMLILGTAEKEYNLDITHKRINVPGGARLEVVTASPHSREGARPTFVVMEETHLWMPSENGPNFARVLRRNLAKLGGRSIEVTNAPTPGEKSVAEATHNQMLKLAADGDLFVAKVLFDTEFRHVEDIEDPEQAIPALRWIYRNSPWVVVEDVFADIQDVLTTEADNRKFYFNEITTGSSGWLKKKTWEACGKKKVRKLKKSDKIALGFKSGSRTGAGAVVACRLEDMSLHLVGMWEKPEDANYLWEVPTNDVDNRVRKYMESYDCYWLSASPQGWQDIIGRWAADYTDVVKVQEVWESSRANWCKAIEQFESAVVDGRVCHDNDPKLTRHILNCHISQVPQGHIIRKENENSTNYIAAAQAAVLALEAAVKAIENGALEEETGSLWSIS